MNNLDSRLDKLYFNAFKDVFQKHYLEGVINPISLDNIPSHVMDKFEGYSKKFILPEDIIKRNFDQSFVVLQEFDEKTYVTTQIKKYYGEFPEKQVYVIDLDSRDKIVSYGEIRYNTISDDSYFKNKPFCGFNGSSTAVYLHDEILLKPWIMQGVRQLKLMNALSFALYGFPLNSDGLIGPDEKVLWENLFRNNVVKKYIDSNNNNNNKKERYAFDFEFKTYSHNMN